MSCLEWLVGLIVLGYLFKFAIEECPLLLIVLILLILWTLW